MRWGLSLIGHMKWSLINRPHEVESHCHMRWGLSLIGHMKWNLIATEVDFLLIGHMR